MRSLICSTLIVLCLYQTAFAQTSEEPSGDFAYAIPEGWTGQKYPDGIVYVSPVFNNDEKCVLTVFQMRPTSGNLENDASNVFREVFNTDPFQNSSYPYPSPTLGKGISPQGWEYFIIKKSIRGQVGDYGSLLGVTVFVAKQGNKVAAVVATSKDPLVSMCFGELVRDEWPRFFHSLQFKNWRPTGQEQAMKQRLAGKWTTTTASVADQYTFTPIGQYMTAAAAQYRNRLSRTEVLETTHAFFGDGAYSIGGNVITFTADDNKSNPTTRWYRLEQESKDLGRTWLDKLCLLQEGISEVCYGRTE